MIDPHLISALPLFVTLTAAGRRELTARAIIRSFAPGESLFSAGSAARGLMVVLEGRVRVIGNAGGREHVVHEERRGGTLGEVPVFAGGGYPATAVAAARTTCLILGREDVFAVLRADPAWSWLLLERLARRVRGLVERLDRITTKPVRARLAVLLLERQAESPNEPFTLGRSQHEVAEELGTVRELVVRNLAALRRDGVVQSERRGRYRITDIARLERLASDLP
ncbi:MAG: Crp/Fnr family transcriptional regulator [Gemmatimonadota bacterium]